MSELYNPLNLELNHVEALLSQLDDMSESFEHHLNQLGNVEASIQFESKSGKTTEYTRDQLIDLKEYYLTNNSLKP